MRHRKKTSQKLPRYFIFPSLRCQSRSCSFEDELGARLFVRGKRSLTLTEEGRFLRGRAQEIVALTEKTERDFRDGIVSYNGVISVGMGETAASRWLGGLAVEF